MTANFSRIVPALLALACIGSRAEAFAQLSRPEPVTVVLLDGSRSAETLLEVTREAVVVARPDSADGQSLMPLPGLLSLEFPAREAEPEPEPLPGADATLEFANGDRVRCLVSETEGDVLHTRFGGTSFDVPLETLRGIVFSTLGVEDGSSALLLRKTDADDLVLLTNGDRLVGQFDGLGESDLNFNVKGREVLVPRDRIAAIMFSPELTLPGIIEGERQIVHSGEHWLTVESLTLTPDGAWEAVTAFGQPVTWSRDAVTRVQFVGNKVVPLSTLLPAEEMLEPYLRRRVRTQLNRSSTGELLSASGNTFASGIGTHSRSRLVYDLGGEFEAFHVTAGLASSAGDIGSVEFAIELDGREVVRSNVVTRASEPLRVTNLDVRGVNSMVLTVDFGRNGDVLDRANWCDAVLVRKP